MKHPKIVFFSIILVLLVAALLLWRRAPQSPPPAPGVETPVAQADSTGHVRLAAKKFAQSILEGDFATMAGLINPRLVTYLGGRETMAATFTKNEAEFEAKGMAFEGVAVGAPAPIQEVGPWQISLVPYQLSMKTPAKLVQVDANLLGLSADHGQNWTFVDLSGNLGEKAFFKLYPELAGNFTYPAKNGPVAESVKQAQP